MHQLVCVCVCVTMNTLTTIYPNFSLRNLVVVKVVVEKKAQSSVTLPNKMTV